MRWRSVPRWTAQAHCGSNVPHAGLLAAGSDDEFKAIELTAWCDSGIRSDLTPNILPARYCDVPGSEDGVRHCPHEMLQEEFSVAEENHTGEHP